MFIAIPARITIDNEPNHIIQDEQSYTRKPEKNGY
jgi:hypothetical protein